MNKKIKVIKRSNIPTSVPLMQTVFCLLALDYWDAPQWIWGAMGFLLLILWTGAIIQALKQRQVDIFNEKSE